MPVIATLDEDDTEEPDSRSTPSSLLPDPLPLPLSVTVPPPFAFAWLPL